MNVYEFLTQTAKLSDEHKQDLKTKRGFSDETITVHRFFSGGKYLLDHEPAFLSNYTYEELVTSGIFTKPERSEKIGLSPQLIENRIVIPYLNAEGLAYFVRPHKLGLEIPIQVYHEFIGKIDGKGGILTEGEFKAVAGAQWGFKTIGIPGISSFSDQHFKRLIEFINKVKLKEICIIFDNEVKNDPSYPNYKEEINKRYDTEYFAYYMCKRLTSEGLDVRIGTLPDSWRNNGKADLDGALASGHGADDIKRCIGESRNHKTFFEELTREAKNVVQRKISQKYYKSHISRNFGKYIATRYRGKHEFEETISNFTIKIIATHETTEEVVREVQLIDEYSNRSSSFALPSAPMTSSDEFAKFCMSKGNYIWRGTKDDMAHIWQGEFFEDDGRHIIETDHVGWIESEKLFLFGNVAIKEDGTELRPDKSNIFWSERKGIKPVPLSASTTRNHINEGVPYLNTSPIDRVDVLNKMVDTIGKFEAYSLLGWISSVVFMEEIFNEFNCYPFLFITGKRGSGKSTIAEWAVQFFGLDTGGKMASDTTSVALQRYLAYYSCLPVFIDEYRNTKNIIYKVAPLRNCYNRQGAGKGIKTSFGVYEAKVRGTIIIAGEETPEDNALLTRCIVINVMERNRTTNHFNWFQANKARLSWHFYDLIKRKHAMVKKYVENLHKGKDYFVSKGLDDRTAINYSVVGTGFMAAFGHMPDDFLSFLTTETVRVKAQYDAENAIGIFFEDILSYQSAGILKDKFWVIDNGQIYIYFHGLYNVWAGEYRRVHGNEPFKAASIRDYLKEENGFVEMDYMKKIGGFARRCVVFNINKASENILGLIHEEAPEHVSRETVPVGTEKNAP